MFSSLDPIPFLEASGAPSAPPARPSAAASQEKLPSFEHWFDRNPLPMFIFEDTSARILAVNDTALTFYGWSRTEFLTLSADHIHPASSIPAFLQYRENIEPLSDSGINNTPGWRHINKEGKPLPVQTAWQRIEYQGRRAILVTVIDQHQAHLTEEENRELASVLNLASDAIIVCDLDRTVLFWNHGAERLYGWSADEAIGQKFHDLFHVDSETVLTCMGGLLGKGEWSGEMKHTRKDGTLATVNSRWTLARNEENGEPKAILLINTDITETKKLEKQFLRTQRLESLGTLASGIAHDLNNILSPILMATSILRSSVKKEDIKMLEIIEGSAERGAGIVKQVLTFARGAEGDKVLLQPKHLATEMTKVMHQTFPKNIDIQTSFPADIWMITGDATQLHQVLLNLCVNARDAIGSKGGTLRVTCENIEVDEHLAATNPGAQLGPHVCFSVTDTGSGMTPEIMEKIFDPFFTTKEQGKGTGLGLATVIGIVQTHKGFITLQSTVGVGTTFKVFIPANREAKAVENHDTDLGTLRGRGETILIVDDEPAIREALVTTLENHGYQCLTAEDGQDALALYFERHQRIAAVITDLHMGIMDGLMLARALKKMTPTVKIIVSSGQLQKESINAFHTLGIRTLLEKPYNAEKLLRSLRTILDGEPAPTTQTHAA